jgi:nicotinamidase-related amidase
VRGTQGAEIIRELAPREGDIIIRKTTYSGFFGTNLDDTLRLLGIDTVRLTGDVTHICVLFTASDAVLRDYRVLIVENGVAGKGRPRGSASHHEGRTGSDYRVSRRFGYAPGKGGMSNSFSRL